MKLAEIFQDNMILQRNKPIKVWGVSEIAQNINVTINDCVVGTYEIPEGEFVIYLPSQKEMFNAKLCIGNVELHNVDIGEVWLASGQSNMEFFLEYDKDFDSIEDSVYLEHFRFYEVGRYSFVGEREDGFVDDSKRYKWLNFSKENANQFSAVASYFGLALSELNVPIGIVSASNGGTSASSWIDKKYLEEDEELKVYIDEFNEKIKGLDLDRYYQINKAVRKNFEGEKSKIFGAWLMKNVVNNEDIENKLKENGFDHVRSDTEILQGVTDEELYATGPNDKNKPSTLHEAMLGDILGYTIRGIIWYQGESDSNKPVLYEKLFSKLIECLREDWDDELPFLFVQLAPFEKWLGCTGENYETVRKSQENVSKKMNKVYMVSSSDVGHQLDIHPKEKKPIGERLALVALDKVYGKDINSNAPEVESVEVSDGCMSIKFVNGDGLYVKGDKVNAIQIIVDGKDIEFESKICGDVLEIHSDEILKGGNVRIEFANSWYYEVNLYNEMGIPAVPFVWNNGVRE